MTALASALSSRSARDRPESAQLSQSRREPQCLLYGQKPSFVAKLYRHRCTAALISTACQSRNGLFPTPVDFGVPASCTSAAAVEASSAAGGSTGSLGQAGCA